LLSLPKIAFRPEFWGSFGFGGTRVSQLFRRLDPAERFAASLRKIAFRPEFWVSFGFGDTRLRQWFRRFDPAERFAVSLFATCSAFDRSDATGFRRFDPPFFLGNSKTSASAL
jgi:hypothetical protein